MATGVVSELFTGANEDQRGLLITDLTLDGADCMADVRRAFAVARAKAGNFAPGLGLTGLNLDGVDFMTDVRRALKITRANFTENHLEALNTDSSKGLKFVEFDKIIGSAFTPPQVLRGKWSPQVMLLKFFGCVVCFVLIVAVATVRTAPASSRSSLLYYSGGFVSTELRYCIVGSEHSPLTQLGNTTLPA
jgi:hypothetical protein